MNDNVPNLDDERRRVMSHFGCVLRSSSGKGLEIVIDANDIHKFGFSLVGREHIARVDLTSEQVTKLHAVLGAWLQARASLASIKTIMEDKAQ